MNSVNVDIPEADMSEVDMLKYLLRNHDAEIDQAWAIGLTQKYPAFFIPAVLLLKRASDTIDGAIRQRIQTEIILSCPDRTALTDFIDPSHSGWDRFYPSASAHHTDTEKTINDFISTYGKSSSPAEDALLERLILSPVPADYFAGVADNYDQSAPLAIPPEFQPKDSTQKQFTEKGEPKPHSAEHSQKSKAQNHVPNHTWGEETLLRESLAKIFIKQHRYERAFEIISKLSLNYPEKSVYFADQLRFLQKLIINQQYLDKEQ